ncbi:MAG: hypothetical protein R2709_08030 [Marmoricola sp.]
MIRSRWSNLVTNESDRHTAFSVEAVVDEMVFVIGPVLVAVTTQPRSILRQVWSSR